jgi:demethylmenaquinone methyltransferase/2-methoxy-6-polyprenyl-1,4-benzoquinol methylase
VSVKSHKAFELSSSDNNQLFSKIAPRYDLLNHLLSLGIDRGWRRRLVEYAEVKPGEKILDVCVGTGDLAIRFAHADSVGYIAGIDLSEEMLRIAKRKIKGNNIGRKVGLLKGDGLSLPFPNNSFDIVSIGFGLRNLDSRQRGISEMVRVLKEGGRLLILEFSPPARSLFGKVYSLYLNTIIQTVGGIVSGSADAYRYLSTSVAGFPRPEEILEQMELEGLRGLHSEGLTGGIAYIYRGQKLI